MDDVIKPASRPQLITGPGTDQVPLIRALAKALDTAFVVPGTNIRFGLDSLLGLVPGVGDAITSAIGGYIVLVAAHLGVPKAVLARMTLNLLTDAAFGAIPFVGDVADVAYKANRRNMALLEQSLAEPKAARRSSVWMLLGLGLVLLLIAAGGVALAFWALRRFSGTFV